MKKAVLFLMVGVFMLACQKPQPAKSESKDGATGPITKASLKTQDDKLNYAVGIEIGKNIKRNKLPLKEPIFMKGMTDGMTESEPLLSDEEMTKAKRDHSTAQREIRQKERDAAGKKNKEEGAKFMAENGKKEGVVTLPDGLQYKILTEGKGPKPAETDRVKVNYKGTLIDGTEFDSSYKRKEPATFSVNRVVKGWTEALQLMPVGSKWQIFVPSALGYGPRGAGEKIGPEATLIFEVELVEIVKEDPNKKTMPGAMRPGMQPMGMPGGKGMPPMGLPSGMKIEAKPKAEAKSKTETLKP